jgi:hypothetical protein
MLCITILWRIDTLPSRGLEANNGKTSVAVQRRSKHAFTPIELMLGKHVPETTVTHATGESDVVYTVRAEEL